EQRSLARVGAQETDNVPVGCAPWGFGFLFELMDDYYPGPNTGFGVCDQEGRILGAGRGVFELSGFREQELLGADLVNRLGLHGWNGDQSPAAIALEWGVRRLGGKLELRTRAGQTNAVTADLFPAYHQDGGRLVPVPPGGSDAPKGT